MQAEQEHLDRSRAEPLYQQLAARLEQAISAGTWAAGFQIPSESSLVDQYGVSRVTVRLAVDELVGKGLLKRQHGRGTFVTGAPLHHDVDNMYNFLGALMREGNTKAELLSYGYREPPEAVACALDIPVNGSGIHLKRRYLKAGKPVALLLCWLSPTIRLLDFEQAERTSTEEMIHKSNIKIGKSHMIFTACLPDEQLSADLGVNSSQPLIHIKRLTFDRNLKTIEASDGYFHPNGYEFSIQRDYKA